MRLVALITGIAENPNATVTYQLMAMQESLMRGETPIVPQKLFMANPGFWPGVTQELRVNAGLDLIEMVSSVVLYDDHLLDDYAVTLLEGARDMGITIESRKIKNPVHPAEAEGTYSLADMPRGTDYVAYLDPTDSRTDFAVSAMQAVGFTIDSYTTHTGREEYYVNYPDKSNPRRIVVARGMYFFHRSEGAGRYTWASRPQVQFESDHGSHWRYKVRDARRR